MDPDSDPSNFLPEDHLIDSHSLSNPYVGDDMNNLHWDYGRNTLIDISNYVRLASDQPSRVGWLWSRVPMDRDEWTCEVDFKIHRDSAKSSSAKAIADGLAFWFTPEWYQEGNAMGFKANWKGVGVIIDTFDNGYSGFTKPRIGVFINDGSYEYNKQTDGRDQDSGFCIADILGKSHMTSLRITYRKNDIFKVETNADGPNLWSDCVTVRNSTKIPEHGHFGFTAFTGSLSANYDVIEVRTFDLPHIPSVEDAPRYNPIYDDADLLVPEVSDGPSAFSIIAIFLVVGLAVFLGFRFYLAKRSRDMKRF